MDTAIVEEIAVLKFQISKLEKQLEINDDARQQKYQYETAGRKVIFDVKLKKQHAAQRTGIIAYLRQQTWKTYVTGWMVYFMIIPFAFLDLSVTIYQHICFWAWEVQKVRRDQYVFVDRHYLEYLNGIEKLYCIYCGYANGVIAFTREVSARTEKRWCPIKHATKVDQAHEHYQGFTEYGDAHGWHSKDDNKS